MTTRLEQAFIEASKLSPKEQDTLADWVLAELRSEKKWDRLFANSQEILSKLAAEAIAEHHSHQTKERQNVPDRCYRNYQVTFDSWQKSHTDFSRKIHTIIPKNLAHSEV